MAEYRIFSREGKLSNLGRYKPRQKPKKRKANVVRVPQGALCNSSTVFEHELTS